MANPSLYKMPEEVDPATMLAVSIGLAIIGVSAVLWVLRLQRPDEQASPKGLAPAWLIGWTNFGIFLCTIIVAVVAVQLFAAEIIQLSSDTGENTQISNDIPLSALESTYNNTEIDETAPLPPKLTPWMAVFAVLLLQLPMLAVFHGLRRFWPESFAGSLNSQTVTILKAFQQALPLFIRYLPIIWIVSFCWSNFLLKLQTLGIIDEFPTQELVKLFSEGGDPVAITLLVLCAIILAPIAEETIFRGGIYRFLKSQTTQLPAQIISALFFAVMHANLMSFLPLVIIGMILARVYEKSGNILVPMCFHGFFNAFTLLMLFIMNHSPILAN